MAATKHEKTCAACGLPNPRHGHLHAHERRGELVTRNRWINGHWRMVWELPEDAVRAEINAEIDQRNA